MARVAIFGGGVGGLTVAHELIERGFQVDVYEKNDICGGKARSLEKDQTGTGGRPNLPGEHGFRFFPGFYQHLDDTMKRIPVGQLSTIPTAPTGPSTVPISPSTAYDNLVGAKDFAIAQEGKKLFTLPPDTPKTLLQWVAALSNLFSNPGLGLADGEKEVLLKRVSRLFAMCRERREQDYECVTWWDYHNVPTPRSDQYNKMFVTGFSRAFVAMDGHKASTMTGANTLAQFFRVFFGKGTMDRVLNAPTNDAWLGPWVAYLEHKGV
ncbi:MAG: NAD(P)-binding protein, partial [Polyangiales bacterium]